MPRFNQTAEDGADFAPRYDPPWIMDGDNQRAVIDAFFEAVVPGQSLVFIYLKHSPLQEERTDRLIVGAAESPASRRHRCGINRESALEFGDVGDRC